MPAGRNGVRKILEGIVQQEMSLPPVVHPGKILPRHVVVNCMDPRVDPTTYARISVNEMFQIRNAGNLVPHASFVTTQTAATEPAVLELAFTKFNTVKQVSTLSQPNCAFPVYLFYYLCR